MSGDLCLLEPSDLSRDVSRKIDVIRKFAYLHGKLLRLDCTCVDTFSSTNLKESGMNTGSAAIAPETSKRTKYLFLTDCYQFDAVTIEMEDTYSDGVKNIVRDIDCKLTEGTGASVRHFG